MPNPSLSRLLVDEPYLLPGVILKTVPAQRTRPELSGGPLSFFFAKFLFYVIDGGECWQGRRPHPQLGQLGAAHVLRTPATILAPPSALRKAIGQRLRQRLA
jgi:hypothetical protein